MNTGFSYIHLIEWTLDELIFYWINEYSDQSFVEMIRNNSKIYLITLLLFIINSIYGQTSDQVVSDPKFFYGSCKTTLENCI